MVIDDNWANQYSVNVLPSTTEQGTQIAEEDQVLNVILFKNEFVQTSQVLLKPNKLACTN